MPANVRLSAAITATVLLWGWAFVGIRSNCMVSNGRDTHESGDDMPLTDAKLCNLKPREKPFKANDGHGLYVLVSTTGAPMAI